MTEVGLAQGPDLAIRPSRRAWPAGAGSGLECRIRRADTGPIELKRQSDPVPRRILVSGASGFIGSHLVPVLQAAGHHVRTASRSGITAVGPLADQQQMRQALEGVEVVIHLAAIAHRHAEVAELERINARWPVTLYRAAEAAGVSEFVFLSSIKVLGNVSAAPLKETDGYRPGDAYAHTKMRAELDLLGASASGGPGLTIIRPPLVYGPGVKANFLSLLRLAALGARGLPLPLGAARAPRSLIGVRNLCSLISAAVGAGGIVHAADPEDLHVAALLRCLGARHLVAVPAPLLRMLLTLTGRRSVFERLFEPLQVDRRQSLQRIGWVPPHTVAEQLEETLAWFRHSR